MLKKIKQLLAKRTVYEKSDAYIEELFSIYDNLNIYFEKDRLKDIMRLAEPIISKRYIQCCHLEKYHQFYGFYLGYIYASMEKRT